MKLPCENAIWYTLPQIRSDLAKELVNRGLTQKEVSEKLGITPSAVSQYLHKKRGGRKKMPGGYKNIIKETASRIDNSDSEDVISKLICRCCMNVRVREEQQ